MDQNRSEATLSRPPVAPPTLDWLGQPYQPTVQYAGFWRRFFAVWIDSIAIGIASKAFEAALSLFFERFLNQRGSWFDVYGFIVTLITYLAFDWFYFAGLESSAWQATLGKRALGIVVIDISGNRISFGRATGRYVAHFISVITFLVGYLIQPFTGRRQALHDLIAGTLVARKDSVEMGPSVHPVPEPHAGQQRRSGVPRWAIGLLAGSLLLCAGCVTLSFLVVLPLHAKYEKSTRSQVAETIATSVTQRIRLNPPQANRLELRITDLDINNGISSGDAGVDWSSDGTLIYGFETGIDSGGISLGMDGSVMYRAMPVVANGEVDITVIQKEVPGLVLGFLLSEKSFAQGMEDGINDALVAEGLAPVSLTLQAGRMVILTAPSI